MPNNAFNVFVIILGFSLLGMPIIFISLSTAPPGLNEFQSTITINSVPGDSQSAIYLNNTANITVIIKWITPPNIDITVNIFITAPTLFPFF